MANITLDQKINANGTITTGAQLLDSGKAIVTKTQIHTNKARNERGWVYWYELELLNEQGTPSGLSWRIGQKAYESRASKGQHILPKNRASVMNADVNPQTVSAPGYKVAGFAEDPALNGKPINAEWDEESTAYNVVIPADAVSAWRDAFEVYNYEPEHVPYNGYGDFVVTYTDKAKSDDEVKALIKNWEGDPCWDIETTEGFSFHYAELKAHRLEVERKRTETVERLKRERLEAVRRQYGFTLDTQAQAIIDLFDEIKRLRDRVSELEDKNVRF